MPKKVAKKKTSKKTSSPASKLWNKYATWIIFGLLGLAVLIYWVFAFQLPKIQEKKDLEASYSQLEKIVGDVTDKNKPTLEEGYKYCRYQSSKLGDGDLYCFVGFELNYSVEGAIEANRIKNESAPIIGDEVIYNPSSKSETDYPSDPDVLIDSIWQNVFIEGLSCGAEYNYPSPNQDSKNLKIFISCSKAQAKTEHYPLRK